MEAGLEVLPWRGAGGALAASLSWHLPGTGCRLLLPTHTVVPRVTCLSGEFLEKPNEPGPCRQKTRGWDQDPSPGKSCT